MAGQVITSAFADNPLTAAIIERYMYSKVLSIALKETVFWKLGRHVPIPPGESKTVTFQRFERLNNPRKPLSEGVTPLGKKMVVTKILAVCEQWGDFVTLTDVAELTVRHEPVQRALELIGIDSAETVDRETQRELISGTNVFFPNKRADRTDLQATDFIDMPLLRKIRAKLRRNGAPAYEGRRYVAVTDPECSQDVMADGTFTPAAQYSNLTALQESELGIWGGIRWMESNNIPVLVRDATMIATLAGDAVAGTETTLADATYHFRLVGLLAPGGFETQFGTDVTQVISGGDDVVTVAVPSDVDGVTILGANLYVAKDSGSFTLQDVDLQGSTTYRLSGNGEGTNGIAYTTTGIVAGPIPPVGVSVHQAYVFGNEYFSCTELKGIEVLRTPPGAQKGDELNQRRSIGWKCFFKPKITNEDFGLRIECASNQD